MSWASPGDLGETEPVVKAITRAAPGQLTPTADQRQRFLERAHEVASPLPAFYVDPHSLATQRDQPLIELVQLTNEQGLPVSWVVGGERVLLRIRAKRPKSNSTLIFAFFVKDRLGQPLFGDDTSLTKSHDDNALATTDTVEAEFLFDMPILPPGDYAFTALVAAGVADTPAALDWLHDALIVKSESASVTTGLVGLPMSNIALFVRDAVEEA